MSDQVQGLLASLKRQLADVSAGNEGGEGSQTHLRSISNALRELLAGYTVVHDGVHEPALASLREHVDATSVAVAELRQRLQSRCEALQVYNLFHCHVQHALPML